MKSKTTALILSILVGGLGIDRFYLGYTGMGILKLLTAGCFGVLTIIDIINIATGRLKPADGSGYDDEIVSKAEPPKSVIDPYGELEKIVKLYNEGVLTDEEYQKLKRDCLNRI